MTDINQDDLIKMISTPGAVGAVICWLHFRTKRVEDRLDMIANHIGAPHPVKIKYRGRMLLLLAAGLMMFVSGCANLPNIISAAGQSHGALHFTLVTPQGTLVYDRANPEGTNTITVGGENGVTTK